MLPLSAEAVVIDSKLELVRAELGLMVVWIPVSLLVVVPTIAEPDFGSTDEANSDSDVFVNVDDKLVATPRFQKRSLGSDLMIRFRTLNMPELTILKTYLKLKLLTVSFATPMMIANLLERSPMCSGSVGRCRRARNTRFCNCSVTVTVFIETLSVLEGLGAVAVEVESLGTGKILPDEP